jgi:DNA-binding CsgD family transcriptional regulator
MQVPGALRQLPAFYAGLLLAGLFGWLLAFPMFGPLLFATAGPAAPTAGLIFVFAHGAGLLLLHLLPAARIWQVRIAGTVTALLTLASAGGFVTSPPVVYAGMAVLGPAAAMLVLAWADGWIGCENRLGALAVAMAGANLVVALVGLPTGLTPAVWLTLMALLILGCSHLLITVPTVSASTAPAGLAAALRTVPPVSLLAVAAFALADFFVGGLWYNILSASAAAVGAWQPAMEAVTYAAAIAALYWLVRGRQGGQLALYSLSALGMGLVVAAAGAAGAGVTVSFRAILLVGLAAGDLFYWDQLGQLGLTLGARRTMGLGLGASLLLIGLANLGSGLVTPAEPGPGRLFLLLGAALLFLVIPVVFRFAAGTAASAGAPPALPPDRPVPAAAPPILTHLGAELTRAEREVFALLTQGATDQEIADRLVISKHTVKFHVRNLLHKAGVANRKELLSHLLAEGTAGAETNQPH